MKPINKQILHRVVILHCAQALADPERRVQICLGLWDLGVYQKPRKDGFFTRDGTPRLTARGRKILDILK